MKKLYLFLILIFASCGASQNTSQVENRATSNSIGGTLYLVDIPNNVYKPGDILIRDKKTGGLSLLTSIDVNIMNGEAQIPNKEFSKDNSFSGLLNFLGLKDFPLTLAPKTLRESNVTLSLESSDVKFKSFEEGLLPLTTKIKKANSEISEAKDILQISNREEIILITDLFYSKDVTLKINGGKNKIDSLNAGFEKIADLNLGIKKNDTVSLDLTIKRDNPLGFAYKRRKLGIKKGYDGPQIFLPKKE